MPRKENNQYSYPSIMPMNHNNDQTEKIFLEVKNSDTHILVVTNNYLFGLKASTAEGKYTWYLLEA